MQRENTDHLENAEILGVQDITHQIEDQARSTMIRGGGRHGKCQMGHFVKQGNNFCSDTSGLYYIEGKLINSGNSKPEGVCLYQTVIPA